MLFLRGLIVVSPEITPLLSQKIKYHQFVANKQVVMIPDFNKISYAILAHLKKWV